MEPTPLQRTREDIEMSLVKVIRHGQITLPAGFRKELAIHEGDYLQAEIQKDCIVLRPQVVLDRNDAISALHALMNTVQDRTEGINAKTIDQEVAEAIQSMRQKKRNA